MLKFGATLRHTRLQILCVSLGNDLCRLHMPFICMRSGPFGLLVSPRRGKFRIAYKAKRLEWRIGAVVT